MVGLLGRGGMGEVYRAEDLKLGQPVALKFLPTDVDHDPDRLERFLTEVRLSLRVTHPNVCRVFDVGQIPDGAFGRVRHFLSMEYVDGEDLASLLRRIGRLPEDKAVEIARQLCAGLAAAHDEGILHRDLKPANIMLDGRGRAKITDFGLASAASGISGFEARIGTPQYMAPEQVAGRELSERTDLYALGLVLYELFTGKRAFEIKDLDDLKRLETSAPTSPSSYVSGLNVLVERAILRCLEPDPAKRPSSASALAAALPGGDPLAMAVAAGDTPSPEMVAAAGTDNALRPAVAWSLAAVAIAGMLVMSFFAQRVAVYRAGAPRKPPDVLIEQARQVLAAAGAAATPNHAWGLMPNFEYLNYAEARREPAGIAANGLQFWYRESPVIIERLIYLPPDMTWRIGYNDPNLRFSGETRVVLDREGRLVELTAMPAQVPGETATAADADWPALFRAAGLDVAEWTPADPQWTPMFHADRQLAWVPRAGVAGAATRAEAASFRGRPVSFAVVFPWSVPERMLATRRSEGERIANLIAVLIFSGLMIGGALTARRNLRLERGDRRGAIRLAGFTAALQMLVWVLDEQHVPSIWELYLFLMAAGWALLSAALVALFYLALEPFVRRGWPTTIVSWSRVLAGKFRDRLVARDVLTGLAAGGVIYAVDICGYVLSMSLTGRAPRLLTSPRPFYGARYVVPELVFDVIASIFFSLALLLFLYSLRLLLRREWAAIGVGALILALPPAIEAGAVVTGVAPFIVQVLAFATMARVGIIAVIAATFMGTVLYQFPVTIPPSGWHAGVGLVGLGVLIAITVAAVREASAARPTDHKAGVRGTAAA